MNATDATDTTDSLTDETIISFTHLAGYQAT
jgi:hypothetical protein